MKPLNRFVDKFAFWRRRRHWWIRFFKFHLVRSFALGLTIVAASISVAVPSVTMPFVLWIAGVWVWGAGFYLLRMKEDVLPAWLKSAILQKNIWVHALLAVIFAGVLMYVCLGDPTYRRYLSSSLAWPFFLLPLVYQSRHGTTGHLRWLLALSVLIVIAVPIALLGPERPILFSAFTSATLLSILALGAQATLQSIREKDARVARLSSIVALLGDREGLKFKHDAIARMVSKELRYPVVHIMLWDSVRACLATIGASGKDPAFWREVQIRSGEGLTGQAFSSGVESVCNDVKGKEGRKKGYIPRKGYEDIESELAIPLRFGRERLGVLDFQSSHRGDFNSDDIEEAKLLATSFSAAIKWNRVARTQLLLWKTLEQGNRTNRLEELIDETLDMVLAHLDASLITFYPLIPETELPKTAFPYRRGHLFEDESKKGGLDSFSQGMPLYQLVRAWDYYARPDATADDLLRGNQFRDNDFIAREKIKSVIFLPLGQREYKVGGLFVNFREHREFSPVVESQIRAFGQAFALTIRSLHDRTRAEDSVRLGVHRNLAGCLYPINTQLGEIRKIAKECCVPGLNTELEELEKALADLRKRVLQDTTGIFDAEVSSVEEALTNTLRSLALNPKLDLAVSVRPEINALPRSLHKVIHNFSVEAASNAIAHGCASSIRVIVNLDPQGELVKCQVIDDGVGFDEDTVTPGQEGIFTLRAWMEKELNGTVSFFRREETGMCVEAQIPILARPEAFDVNG
jgi:GAF domain-containing protein